jgi:hypothetical protein
MRYIWILGLIFAFTLCLKAQKPSVSDTPTPKKVESVESVDHVKPAHSIREPFVWEIRIQAENKEVYVYVPNDKIQMIPLGSFQWRCAQTGLKRGETDGRYVEVREIVCVLPSGQAIGSMTVCTRDSSGKVTEDAQVLKIVDQEHLRTILMSCDESKGEVDGTPKPPEQQGPPAPSPTSRQTFTI